MTNIVMLVKDRPRLTEQAIESLYNHTHPSEFTLTIVDDESEFLTRRYLNGIERENFTMVRVENSGHVLSQLKNLGVYWTQQRFAHVRGSWLYLSDNDVWFADRWLPKLVGTAEVNEKHGFRLFGGQVHPFHHPVGPGWPGLDEVGVIDGPSWLMRWQTWYAHGPLDRTTAAGVCQGEDCVFCDRVRLAGGRFGVVRPHLVVHTGLTNSNGEPAPGAEERRKMIPDGVFAE